MEGTRVSGKVNDSKSQADKKPFLKPEYDSTDRLTLWRRLNPAYKLDQCRLTRPLFETIKANEAEFSPECTFDKFQNFCQRMRNQETGTSASGNKNGLGKRTRN
jgi:hypothetical protein